MIIVFDNLKKCINTDAILGFEVTQDEDGDYCASARLLDKGILKMVSSTNQDHCWNYILSILDFIAKGYTYINSYSILQNAVEKEEGEYLN